MGARGCHCCGPLAFDHLPEEEIRKKRKEMQPWYLHAPLLLPRFACNKKKRFHSNAISENLDQKEGQEDWETITQDIAAEQKCGAEGGSSAQACFGSRRSFV